MTRMNTLRNVAIQIDFADSAPLYFQDPVTIIETDNPEEVDTCMRKIQSAVDNGFYAAGYVAYEAAEGLRPEYPVAPGVETPLIWFGIFKSPAAPPEEQGKCPFHLSNWKLSTTERDYEKNIERIRRAISRGETYQVNYTARLNAQFLGYARSLYEQLKASQKGGTVRICIRDGTRFFLSPRNFFFSGRETVCL
ncbi:hypothetical protein EPH95_01680 [Salicibibacter halophilus]|uniref:Uncharacterized protein n=2 Tax=Salicibibacter halophilus TaxID=2502791 RepID=A0A514LDW6_9BACI|nr:hypothetical protein EPH95_01680 [Salicibibacter halophilus]